MKKRYLHLKQENVGPFRFIKRTGRPRQGKFGGEREVFKSSAESWPYNRWRWEREWARRTSSVCITGRSADVQQTGPVRSADRGNVLDLERRNIRAARRKCRLPVPILGYQR